MLKTPPADRSRLSLPDLSQIAISSGLIVRKPRKFDPAAFLQSMLSTVSTGLASFNQLAAELGGRTSRPMAPQSLHQRFGKQAPNFLLGVLNALMEQRYAPVAKELAHTMVRRLLVEDSSGQAMPKSNAEDFPAHGNHHGNTAGVKVDFAYDILSGSVVGHSLHAATEQDKTIGKDLVDCVGPSDLVLRDMGYFSLDEFTLIERRGAFWLTRLPLNTGVSLPDGTAIEKLLGGKRRDIHDLAVFAGGQRKACRLVAVRARPEVAEARRTGRRRKARKNGTKPCKKGLVRDGWHLMLTNLPAEDFTVAQLTTVYRARWAVEIEFRAWKQSLNLDAALNRRSNRFHMEALVIAAMIAHQLAMRIARAMGQGIGRERVSREKLYDLFAVHIVKARTLGELCGFDPDLRHIVRDRRARQSPINAGLDALT